MGKYFNLPQKILEEIRNICDVNKDGRIERGSDEEKSFINAIFSYDNTNKTCLINDTKYKVTPNSVFCIDFDKYNFDVIHTDALSVSTYKYSAIEIKNTTKAETKTVSAEEAQIKANIKYQMIEEAKKRGVNPEKIDYEYWMNYIYDTSKNYNIPEEILVAIMARESNGKFDKNVDSVNGRGPMQITSIAIKDFFPGAKGNRFKLFEQLDKKLLYDILYEKDKNGNFVKDANGNMILKYKNPSDLLKACAKDDKLGIKVGALIFKLKYANAISVKTNCSLKQAVKNINDNMVEISKEEHEDALKLAFYNYNGNPAIRRRYSEDVIDSLKTIHHFDFEFPMG